MVSKACQLLADLMRAVALSGVFIAAATCGDQGPAAPSNLEPGHAWFAVRPSFEAMPAGGPTIALSKITAVLTGPTGDVFNAEANFANGQAVLEFNVPVTGGAEEFTLNATAYDLSGQVAYTFTQKYTLKPGANNSLPSPTFKYSGLDAGLSSLKLTPATMTLAAGASASFAASGTIANGQSITPNVGWSSSDPSVATVNQSGSVTAGQSQGTATITATSVTGLAASASVKVTAPVAKVIATPASLQLIRGTAGNVSAELRDATNHVIDDRTAAWTSSDPSIATVSATGAVSAVKIGKATLTASAEGQSATVAVTVISPVDHLEVTPTDVLFSSIGETAPLSVKIVPVAGASVAGLVVNFSSNSTGVVAVDPKGVMTSIGNGVAKVTAELDGLTASVNVTVQQATSSIAVAPRAVSVSSVGATQSFSVTILDAKGQPIVNPTVVWSSSDPTVAQVTGSGSSATATAKKAGSASIIATADGKVDAATFIVAPVVKLLAVVSDKAQILTGGTANLTAYLADANGNPVSQTTATFTSTTPNVASVAGNVVTGLAPGVARIMGTSGGLTGFVNIMITSPSGGGNGLVIGPATAEKIPGGTQQFSVTSGGQGPFTWTVNGIPGGNATFGTIDGQGFYTAPNAVPSPASFDVCANQASPSANGCATVTINPIPTSGGEVIVFNDDNMFDNSYGAPYAGNIQLFKNLVDFTAAGPRAAQTGVLFFHGHDSGCGGYIDSECLSGSYSTFYATIQSIGYTVSEVNDVTASITSIAPTIKVIFLMMPEQTFSVSEINILKAFAADGGRIVYVGERTPFLDYNGLQGTAVENQFLSDMGAVMRNIGGDYSCPGIMDAAHIRPHQVTTGVTSISMACVSAVQLGPNDYALVYDETTPGVVLAAVAKVDLTPISGPPPQSSDRRARPTRAAPAASPDMIEHGWGRGPRPTAQPPAKVRPPD